MATPSKAAAAILSTAPPLPMERCLWQSVVKDMRISKRQAEVAELMMRDLTVRQIVIVTGLKEGTVKDYQKRIWRRIGCNGKTRMVLHIMTLALQKNGGNGRPKKQ